MIIQPQMALRRSEAHSVINWFAPCLLVLTLVGASGCAVKPYQPRPAQLESITRRAEAQEQGIDGMEKGSWSGQKGWSRASFHIGHGLHTFSWRYTKDSNMDHGLDRAWIDFILFPPGAYSKPDSVSFLDPGGNNNGIPNLFPT